MLKNIKCQCGWDETLDVVDGEYIECPECECTYMVNFNEQRISYTTYSKCKICGELYENNQLIVEYNFIKTTGSDGMIGVKGISKAYFTKDSDGKYVFDHIEEVSSEDFNYN